MSVRKAVRRVEREVEFMVYTVDNINEIDEWMGQTHRRINITNPKTMFHMGQKFQDYIICFVGEMPLVPGDIVMKSGNSFFVWKPDIFNIEYEEVSND